jgi:hypothetical protein
MLIATNEYQPCGKSVTRNQMNFTSSAVKTNKHADQMHIIELVY